MSKRQVEIVNLPGYEDFKGEVVIESAHTGAMIVESEDGQSVAVMPENVKDVK